MTAPLRPCSVPPAGRGNLPCPHPQPLAHKVGEGSRGCPHPQPLAHKVGEGSRGCPHPQPLAHKVGEGCRGARQCVPPLPPRGRGGLWSAEAKLPPTLKLTLPHSKQTRARLTPLSRHGQREPRKAQTPNAPHHTGRGRRRTAKGRKEEKRPPLPQTAGERGRMRGISRHIRYRS